MLEEFVTHLALYSYDGLPRCACASGFELMYDGFSCAKPSAYFVILQENVADISRASLDKPINFDSLGVINITNSAPTTADIDQMYGSASALTGECRA
ncbi:hypothetical protein ANCCAN_21855 [Ancylostoma caninum]|uniref:Uncharacterized protein n=1 Tax=Ancylostoma caninum TaxID=29170 RepID=A0A368FJB8_ANCCA|nr:hypothetical protein ANCCAN_21855 [Ancylostoma caninum]